MEPIQVVGVLFIAANVIWILWGIISSISSVAGAARNKFLGQSGNRSPSPPIASPASTLAPAHRRGQ